MKRTILLAILALLIVNLFAADVKPENEGLSKYGRWSIAVDAGFTRFDGDLHPEYKPMGILMSPNFAVSLEYNLSPALSIGVNAGGLFFDQEDKDETYQSGAMTTSAYLSTDLFNLLTGKKNSIFGLWFSGGVGMGGLYMPEYTTTRTHEPALIPQKDGVIFPPAFFVFPLKFTLEFNISKAYCLGLTGGYVYTNTDQLESVQRHEYNDQWETAGISLRYKFLTKNDKHFRDEVFSTAAALPSLTLITALQTEVTHLHGRLDDRLGNLEQRVEKVEGILSNDGLDTDQDGVPDVRDLEPNTPRGNAVDFWGRSIAIKTVAAQDCLQSVYFDFDSSELDKAARITIIKVAEKMQANPSLMLEIRGYTDSPGANNYNQQLSQRRSEKVKAELVKVYNISASRMVANGRGVVPNPPNKHLQNRRCDFFFSE